MKWFLSLEDAREKIESWRRYYNEWRPYGSLDDLSPRRLTELRILYSWLAPFWGVGHNEITFTRSNL